MTSAILHVDMDAFYASIEQRDAPELRGRPVVVGGHGRRGVVAASSYEARRFGVRSAMPMARALTLCPEAVVVPPRMHHYASVSRRIMAILREYSPVVDQISIDEAFVDLTGTERLFGPIEQSARRIKRRIRDDERLTVSIGIGTSRFIAKLASDVRKPDGLLQVEPGTESEFVLTLPLKDLWGVGAAARRRLESLGIGTVAALRTQRIEFLRGHFGDKGGEYLFRVCRGEDPGIFIGRGGRHSVSSETTFDDDIADSDELHRQLLWLAEDVFHRTLVEQWRGRTIQLKFRFPPFETHTAARTLPRPPASTEELTRVAWELLEARRAGRPLRLIGVGISGTQDGDESGGQGDLFAERETLDPTVVELRRRFGSAAISRASFLGESTRRGPGAAEGEEHARRQER